MSRHLLAFGILAFTSMNQTHKRLPTAHGDAQRLTEAAHNVELADGMDCTDFLTHTGPKRLGAGTLDTNQTPWTQGILFQMRLKTSA